jgi:hypothetical protein
MAIPRKVEAKPSFWQAVGNLKKGQLAGLTCLFAVAGIGIAYLFSDRRKYMKRMT